MYRHWNYVPTYKNWRFYTYLEEITSWYSKWYKYRSLTELRASFLHSVHAQLTYVRYAPLYSHFVTARDSSTRVNKDDDRNSTTNDERQSASTPVQAKLKIPPTIIQWTNVKESYKQSYRPSPNAKSPPSW